MKNYHLANKKGAKEMLRRIIKWIKVKITKKSKKTIMRIDLTLKEDDTKSTRILKEFDENRNEEKWSKWRVANNRVYGCIQGNNWRRLHGLPLKRKIRK